MTIALWIVGISVYLFIGALLGKLAAGDDEDVFPVFMAIVLWPIMIPIGFGSMAAKALRKRRKS